MCPPSVIRCCTLMRHNGGNTLKSQDRHEGLRALPLKAMECERYRCQETLCKGGTFLLDYTYAGHSAEVKQQIVDMAMNASGIRDTARVLHVSPTTVIKELKKKGLRCN